MNAWKPIYTRKERFIMAVQTAGLIAATGAFMIIMVLLA